MVRLHLLGFTPDLKGLVFSGRRGGKRANYFVAVDDRFFEALEQLEAAREKKAGQRSPRRGEDEIEEVVNADLLDLEGARALAVTDSQELPIPQGANSVESKLSPREIQKLLREGRSVAEVARRAGVDPEWVERFTGPVREERAGVIRMTRQAVLERPRLGRSGLRLGEAVVRNLESRKATAETLRGLEEGWDAKRVRPKTWLVRLRFYHRGKNRTAEWELNTDTRRVEARNKLGTELGWWPRPEQERERSGEGNDGSGGSARSKSPTKKKSPKEKKRSPKKKSPKRSSEKGKKGASSGRTASPEKGSSGRSSPKKRSGSERRSSRRSGKGD